MLFIHKRNVTHCLIETYSILHASHVLVLCVSVFIEFCFDCALSFALRPSSFDGFAFQNSLRFGRPNSYAFCVLVSETHTYLNSLAFRPSAFWF